MRMICGPGIHSTAFQRNIREITDRTRAEKNERYFRQRHNQDHDTPRRGITLELLRRSNFVKASEDFFESPGKPVTRTLRAFRGLRTYVLTLIRCFRAHSLRLFHGRLCTLDGRVLHIPSLVTDLSADVFRLLDSDLRTLDGRVFHILSLVTDL